MDYGLIQFNEDLSRLRAVNNHDRILSSDQYPEDFCLFQAVEFADNYLKTNGVLSFVKDGIYKKMVEFIDIIKQAYDFDDWDEYTAIYNLSVYKIYDYYNNWIMTNDRSDTLLTSSFKEDLDEMKLAEEEFDSIREQVLNIPIEQALLVAMLTEKKHSEMGGMCHECDDPPLTVEHVITNNKNYSELFINPALSELLGLDSLDVISILDHLNHLKVALAHEVEGLEIDNLEF